jgi:hypothetical protein
VPPESLEAAAIEEDPLALVVVVVLAVTAEAPPETLDAAALAFAAVVFLVPALAPVVALESLDAAAVDDLAAAETLLRN